MQSYSLHPFINISICNTMSSTNQQVQKTIGRCHLTFPLLFYLLFILQMASSLPCFWMCGPYRLPRKHLGAFLPLASLGLADFKIAETTLEQVLRLSFTWYGLSVPYLWTSQPFLATFPMKGEQLWSSLEAVNTFQAHTAFRTSTTTTSMKHLSNEHLTEPCNSSK